MVGKLKFFSLLFALVVLVSCKTGQSNVPAIPWAGMFKVAILYPNGDGKTFDMDYYEKKHMPMVASFLGRNLIFYEIDKGIAGRTTSDKVPFLAVGYFYVSDVAEYNKAIAQNRNTIVEDFKNYTNIQPIVNISETTKVIYNGTKK